jgi:adenine deaminase
MLKDNPSILGLGEMMNCPGVINRDPQVMAKLKIFAGDASKIIDGHAPFVTGEGLKKYIAAGISTDHECSTAEEVLEKILAGMFILAREGSSAKNVETIIKAIQESGLSDADGFDRIAFCTDDKHIRDIREKGDIAENIKKTIALGIPAAKAYKIASYNAASIYGLKNLGVVGAAYQADLVVLDDVENVTVHSVYHKGIKVSEGAAPLKFADKDIPHKFLHSINVKGKGLTSGDLVVRCGEQAIDLIGLVPNQILTKIYRATATDLSCPSGVFIPNGDYSKIAVIERHHATGKIGAGIVKGFTLTGAIATTVSHDSHNIIVVGSNDEDMIIAVEHVKKIGGGFVLARGGKIVGDLPLPICGLMTAADTSATLERLVEMSITARGMGVPDYYDPFITLSFLALTVIPEIRITPRGIVSYL